jgi:hypothetical protein
LTTPKKTAQGRNLVLLAMLAAGAYLRLWHIAGQIPFDDEWHAISFVVDHDHGYLLTHSTRVGANSVPQNLYLRLAFQTIGLSEWSIVLPSLAAGILLLWYYPRWVWDRLGACAGILSGVLLALAPFLIFYSRTTRPYAPLLLLEFLAITHLIEWARAARRYHAISAVALGALATWVHITAVPPLLAAWTAAYLLQRREHRLDQSRGPSPGRILATGFAMLAAACLLTLPALVREANPAANAYSPFSLRTADTVSQLVCGSPLVGLRVVLGASALLGLFLAAREVPRELAVLASAAVASIATVLIAHPLQSEVGAIFARYSLPVFLLTPLAMAAAGQWMLGLIGTPALRRFAGVAGLVGLTVALYFSGPLPFVFIGDASFTKHPAFQYGYSDFSAARSLPDPMWEQFPPISRAQLHPFYATLGREGGGAPLIEYPFPIGQDTNRFYFAQMLHRRPVLAGYYASGAGWFDRFGLSLADPLSPGSTESFPGVLMSDMTIDHALGHVSHPAGIRFRTVIDISDVNAIRASGAEYLVLHWNLPREFLFLEVSSRLGRTRGRFVARIRDRLLADLGNPIVNDESLTVFKLR